MLSMERNAYTSKICLHSVNYILKHRFTYGTNIQAIPHLLKLWETDGSKGLWQRLGARGEGEGKRQRADEQRIPQLLLGVV